MQIKKWIIGSVTFLLFIISCASFSDTSTFFRVYQRCGNTLVPLRSTNLLVTNFDEQFFLRTNEHASITLNEEQSSDFVMAYLANDDEIIFPGCKSDMTPTMNGEIFLNGHCPSRNCNT